MIEAGGQAPAGSCPPACPVARSHAAHLATVRLAAMRPHVRTISRERKNDMLDLQEWQGHTWEDLGEYQRMEADLIDDLTQQLAAHDVELVQTLPNDWRLSAIAQSPAHDRYVFIAINDVRDDPFWAENVTLRRMSSVRDWKGDQNHHCAWGDVGMKAAELLTPAYDDEIL